MCIVIIAINSYHTCTVYLYRWPLICCRATVRLVLHSNSAVNFFIYAARLRDFRDAFHRDVRVMTSAMTCRLFPCPPNSASRPASISETEPSIGTTMAALHQQRIDDESAQRDVIASRRLRAATSALYALTMTLDRDDTGQVHVVEVKTQHITDNGSIVPVSWCRH